MTNVLTHIVLDDFSERDESLQDRLDWCKDWTYIVRSKAKNPTWMSFTFIDRRKALLFKLRWA